VPAPGGAYLMSGSGGLTSWFLNLQTEEEGVLRIGPHGWQVRAAFPGGTIRREQALEAFHDRYDPPEKDRRERGCATRWSLHLVLVRELR
jgi:hypothetical protein